MDWFTSHTLFIKINKQTNKHQECFKDERDQSMGVSLYMKSIMYYNFTLQFSQLVFYGLCCVNHVLPSGGVVNKYLTKLLDLMFTTVIFPASFVSYYDCVMLILWDDRWCLLCSGRFIIWTGRASSLASLPNLYQST